VCLSVIEGPGFVMLLVGWLASGSIALNFSCSGGLWETFEGMGRVGIVGARYMLYRA